MFRKKEDKDERAIAVEKSGFTLAYQVISFSLLVDVFFRAVVLEEASWDLLGIVIGGGLVATVYQTVHKTGTRSWVKTVLLSIVGAFLVAAVIMAAGIVRR